MKTTCPNCGNREARAGQICRCFRCGLEWKPARVVQKKFYCIDHQGKSGAYISALLARGWERTDRYSDAAFLLVDIDAAGRRSQIRDFCIQNPRPVFMYPHCSRPVIQWDGMYTPSECVTAVFTLGQAGVDVPKTYGYKKPIHAVGWPYGDILPFRPCRRPKNILFAPIHVNGNLFLSNEQRSYNSETFRRLLKTRWINLTVRYLYDLEATGLWHVPGVEYIKGKPDQSTREIDAADLVVSHQTMAYIAIARGAPTVMMAEDAWPISQAKPNDARRPKTWDTYKHLMVYPYDILATNKTRSLFDRAGASDAGIADWRNRHIGGPFQPDKFVDILEAYLA